MEEHAHDHPARVGPVPLYLSAPTFAIALDELEHAARDRASLLVLLSVIGERFWRGRRGASVPTLIQENAFYQQLAAGDARLDLTSHYALRLAFCKYVESFCWCREAALSCFSIELSDIGVMWYPTM